MAFLEHTDDRFLLFHVFPSDDERGGFSGRQKATIRQVLSIRRTRFLGNQGSCSAQRRYPISADKRVELGPASRLSIPEKLFAVFQFSSPFTRWQAEKVLSVRSIHNLVGNRAAWQPSGTD